VETQQAVGPMRPSLERCTSPSRSARQTRTKKQNKALTEKGEESLSLYHSSPMALNELGLLELEIKTFSTRVSVKTQGQNHSL